MKNPFLLHIPFPACCLLLLLALTGCKPSAGHTEADNGRPHITVAIEPLRYFTQAIAGDAFQVVSLVPGEASPETYDPTPRQLVELSSSRAFLGTGHLGFELAWTSRLQAAAPGVEFINLSQGLPLLADVHGHYHDHEGHTHSHEGHSSVEPHIWCSAPNALHICHTILSTLCRLDTTRQAYFQARHDSLTTHIEQVDSLIQLRLSAPGASRSFLIYHPSLTYFARDYRLHQIPIEESGKEPSPDALARLVRQCHDEKVQVVFVQPQFDIRNAQLIARQTGARIVRINPLAYQWDEEMTHIAESLSE